MRILGLDPGSRYTGYGLIERRGADMVCLLQGRISCGSGEMGGRLAMIHDGIEAVIRDGAPVVVAVESVFVNRNVQSALVLGQARGAALTAIGRCGLPIHEYSPASVKLAVVGHGRAEKQQVQHMVGMLLGLSMQGVASDAADALAVAICHAHHGGIPGGTRLPAGMRWGRR